MSVSHTCQITRVFRLEQQCRGCLEALGQWVCVCPGTEAACNELVHKFSLSGQNGQGPGRQQDLEASPTSRPARRTAAQATLLQETDSGLWPQTPTLPLPPGLGDWAAQPGSGAAMGRGPVVDTRAGSGLKELRATSSAARRLLP